MDNWATKLEEDPRALVEFEKLRFELMWRHFDLHARQRVTMFNFFIVLTPFLFGGCFVLFREASNIGPIPAIVSAIAGALLALIFFLLDRRNRQLYRVSESALSLLEGQFLFTSFRALRSENKEYPGVIAREKQLYDQRWLKHSVLIASVYWLALVLFILLATHFLALRQGWYASTRGVRPIEVGSPAEPAATQGSPNDQQPMLQKGDPKKDNGTKN